jgi:glutaredoxin 3
MVQSAIEKSPIVIFSKSWCPYCRRAKALLKEKFADVEQTIFEYARFPAFQRMRAFKRLTQAR